LGETSDRIFRETTSLEPHAEKAARVAIDRLALSACGIRSVVLCNANRWSNVHIGDVATL
jgi:hypothetical protein